MASSLRRHQFALTVHDIVPAPVQALEELGAQAAPGVAAVARASDVAITRLSGPREVTGTILGPTACWPTSRPAG